MRKSGVDLEKTLLRKVGEAIEKFRMIRAGDRVAVAVSGGKDSMAMLEALLLLPEARSHRLFRLRLHRRAGQIPAAYRTYRRVSPRRRSRMDVSSAITRRFA